MNPAAAPVAVAGRLRYGGDADFAPFESLDAAGRPVGFQVDLLAELGAATGLAVDITLRPWAETEAAFRAGRLDVVAMVDTPERRAWARFAHSHATPAFGIYHRAGRPDAQSLMDLAGTRIAVLDHEAMRATQRTWLAALPATFVPQPEAAVALQAVARGEADLALLPRAYANPALARRVVDGVVASGFSPRLQPYALAVAPGAQDLLARLQRGLDTLESRGRIEALRVHWLSSHHEAAERSLLARGLAIQREWTWGVAGASTLALAALGLALKRRGERIARERTRRRNAEQALQQAEAMLERAFGHHPEAMLVIERGSGIVRDANAAACTLLGVAADALIGQPLAALARHLDDAAREQLVRSLDADGLLQAVPLALTRADGARRDCLVSADPMLIDGQAQVFCIVRDITDALARDARMRQGYDELARELAASRQALHEFTRTVAHDMKAPLRAVRGFVGLLRERLRAGHVQEAMAYGEHIDRAAQRMDTMVQALTRLAQVGRVPLQRQPVDMRRLARDTWDLLAAAEPARTVEFRLADALPAAQADEALAAQVWQNLLDNAWKYTGRSSAPKVAVDSFREGEGTQARTWYRVADNGAGFDMARAERLYQPFQRMHAGSDFAGSGVGLSLVRRIVEHHGGEIRLRSAPGVGTVAEFTLDAVPRAVAAHPAPATAPAH